MKRIISLLLVLILGLSMLFLAACDEDGKDKDTEPPATTVATTEAVVTTAAPEEPVAVDNVDGKNAKQLIEKFIAEYKVAKSFDMAYNIVDNESGEKSETNIAFKVTETDLWVEMTMDGETMKVWLVDDVGYVENSEGKFKAPNVSSEEILGEGFFESIMSSMPSEMNGTIAKKYEEAQLYYYKNVYYITISFTDAEAEQMELEKGYTETIYFDAEGKLRKLEIVSGENRAVMVINSYGEPLEIDPPENASEFEGPDNSGMPPQVEEV